MEEIRQQEYVSNIPPSKPQQTHQKDEGAEEFESAPLPFPIFLETFRKTKAEILSSTTRSEWLDFKVELNFI